MISQIIDGGAIEADGGASAPVGPSVATPLFVISLACPLGTEKGSQMLHSQILLLDRKIDAL